MLNKQEFKKIMNDLALFEKNRELEIEKSRDIIRMSKLIINSLHRKDLKDAAVHVKEIKIKIKKLDRKDYDISLNNVAMQEYVEALCYYEFVVNNYIPTRADLNADTENYLLGMCDLTGELVRRAVDSAIRKDFNEVLLIKSLVAEIYGMFLEFNLRNGELRKKMDSIKYNLMKLEDLAYKVSLK